VSSVRDAFGTEALSLDLVGKTARGMSFTVAAQACKFMLQIVSVVVLARLLAPSDFGLVTMVVVVTGVVQVVSDGGLSAATIQYPAITHEQVSSLFWINAGLGAALTGALMLAAPLVAWIYHDPRLTAICLVSSLSFLIGGFAVQPDALLRRRMCFRDLAFIDVTTTAAGIAAAFLAALTGLGYWALILMPLVAAAVRLLMLWIACAWRPGRMQRAPGLRRLLAFGVSVAGGNIVGAFAANITPFAIGLAGGPHVLGLYNRANTLSSLPSGQLMPSFMSVAQPALARVAGEPQRFQRAALSLLRKMSMFGSWITVTVIACADGLVAVFLGPGWEGASDLLRLLAVFALVEPMAGSLACMLIAYGKPDALLRWKFFSFLIIALSVCAGTVWGVTGIVASFSLSGVLVRFPAFVIFSARHLPFSAMEVARATCPFIALGGVTLVLLTGIGTTLPADAHLVSIAVLGASSALIYGLGALAVRGMRREVFDLLRLAKAVLSARTRIVAVCPPA
jgi:PST family polysaccharide transporter